MDSTQIQLFNACRLYLGVTMLSDITTSSGTHIRQKCYHGIKSTTFKPRHLFPYQQNPSPASWRIWRRGIAIHTYPASQLLKSPLTQWLVTGDTTNQLWTSYLDIPTQQVYIRRPEGNFCRYSSRNSVILQDPVVDVTTIPRSAVPVDIDSTTDNWRLKQFSPPLPSHTSTPPSSFKAFIQELEDWEFQLLRNVEFATDPFTLMSQWTTLASTSTSPSPSVTICSDGSAPDFVGTFGWSMSFSNKSNKPTTPAQHLDTDVRRSDWKPMVSYQHYASSLNSPNIPRLHYHRLLCSPTH
jgi:hypothetical protein